MALCIYFFTIKTKNGGIEAFGILGGLSPSQVWEVVIECKLFAKG